MIDPHLRELGTRARACKHFRLMKRMQTLSGYTILSVWPEGGAVLAIEDNDQEATTFWRTAEVFQADAPDLSDPATKGCILSLVREAHREPEAYASIESTGWFAGLWGIFTGGDAILTQGHKTEEAALVAALEAAT